MDQTVRKASANSELQCLDRLTDVGFGPLVISGITQLVGCVTKVSVYMTG